MIKREFWEKISEKWSSKQEKNWGKGPIDGGGIQGEPLKDSGSEWDSDLDDIFNDIIKNEK